MGMTTEELGNQLKAGKILAKDMVPKLAAALRELAAPGLNAALERLDAHFGRLGNSWDRFQKIIYDAGLEEFLKIISVSFKQILDASDPIARMLGGIAKGFSDIVFAIQLPIALLLDWMEYMGWIDSETGKFAEGVGTSFEWIGRVISWVLGALGLRLVYTFSKSLFGLVPVIRLVGGVFAKMFARTAVTSALTTAATTASASGGLAATFAALGTGLGAITGAAITSAVVLGVVGLGVLIGKLMSDFNVLWTNDIGTWLGGKLFDWTHGGREESLAKAPASAQLVTKSVNDMAQDTARKAGSIYTQSQGKPEQQTVKVVIEEKHSLAGYIKATTQEFFSGELGANTTGK